LKVRVKLFSTGPTCRAPTPPSRPVPVPNGMMGSWWWWQILARALTSSTDRGNTTTSGGRHLTWQEKTNKKQEYVNTK